MQMFLLYCSKSREQINYDVLLRRMGLTTVLAIDNDCHMWNRNCLPFRSTRGYLRFQWDQFCSIFSFLCNVLQIVVCPLVPFLLAIALSVLRFTACDDHFSIFKLYSQIQIRATYKCDHNGSYVYRHRSKAIMRELSHCACSI